MGKKNKRKKAPTKTILIGLHRGEFGWMLQYVARARHKSVGFKNVIVACEEGLEYLYEDFATKIHLYPFKKGWRDRFCFRGRRCRMPDELIINHPKAKIYLPTNSHCIKDRPQYIKYGVPNPELKYDLLIHARSVKQGDYIDRLCGGNRNWKPKNYCLLIDNLKAELGKLRIGSIGSKKGAHHIPKTEDLRGLNIRDLCNVMASSRVIVGTSSFPLHLASLCGLKHVVITHGRRERSLGKKNRWRYEKAWNPLRTPVKVIEHRKWNPKVNEVFRAVRRFM